MMLDHHRIAVQAPWEDRGPDVTVPPERVRVVVTTRWRDGSSGDVVGWAKAWTPRAMEVRVPHPEGGGAYSIWVPVADVRRAEPEDA